MFGVLFFCKQDSDPCLHFGSRTCDSSPQLFNPWFVFSLSGYLVNLGTSLSTLSAGYYPPSPFLSARCGNWSNSDKRCLESREIFDPPDTSMLTAYYASGKTYAVRTYLLRYNMSYRV